MPRLQLPACFGFTIGQVVSKCAYLSYGLQLPGLPLSRQLRPLLPPQPLPPQPRLKLWSKWRCRGPAVQLCEPRPSSRGQHSPHHLHRDCGVRGPGPGPAHGELLPQGPHRAAHASCAGHGQRGEQRDCMEVPIIGIVWECQ